MTDLGQAQLSDDEVLVTVRETLSGTTRMGAFMVPGWGTGRDIRRAAGHGADIVGVAAHCTEANVIARHLGIVRELGLEAHAVLLMIHMTAPERLAKDCGRNVAYGAQAVGIMDSAGHYLPDDVTERVERIVEAVGDVPVIFHGHNNLAVAMAVAVANSVAAVEAVGELGLTARIPRDIQLLGPKCPRPGWRRGHLTTTAVLGDDGRRHLRLGTVMVCSVPARGQLDISNPQAASGATVTRVQDSHHPERARFPPPVVPSARPAPI
ncbi:hypothetical protein [Streptomyces sp. NPDC048606]|uniref:hypothetical protein n=1 Tax=Streptomyces sp. NPDC048606 TaxID=3154726 RepID=UPI00341665E6